VRTFAFSKNAAQRTHRILFAYRRYSVPTQICVVIGNKLKLVKVDSRMEVLDKIKVQVFKDFEISFLFAVAVQRVMS